MNKAQAATASADAILFEDVRVDNCQAMCNRMASLTGIAWYVLWNRQHGIAELCLVSRPQTNMLRLDPKIYSKVYSSARPGQWLIPPDKFGEYQKAEADVDELLAEEDEDAHTFYAVRNKDGEYYRAKGYGGSGSSWKKRLADSRIYGRIRPATSCVNFWARTYPEYGIPEIVKLRAIVVEVLNQDEKFQKTEDRRTQRMKKAGLRKARADLRKQQQRVQQMEEDAKK